MPTCSPVCCQRALWVIRGAGLLARHPRLPVFSVCAGRRARCPFPTRVDGKMWSRVSGTWFTTGAGQARTGDPPPGASAQRAAGVAGL